MDVATTNVHELKKHVAIIHNASQMTLIQKKIFNALLDKAYPELTTVEIHEITIREILDLIGFSSNNHKVVKDSLQALLDISIEWNVLDENDEEDWTGSKYLASARLKGSYCYYSYSAHLRPLLYQPSMYGLINMEIQKKFKSVYGLALYENCVRYRRLKHTRWFELPIFRKLMGVQDGQYKNFRDFKRRILDVGVREVNQFSDLEITPEFKYTARTVTAIRFILKNKIMRIDTSALLSEEKIVLQNPSDTLLRTLCNELGLTLKLAKELVEKYGSPFIEEKVALIISSPSYVNGTIRNLTGYLLKSLEANFKPPKSSAENIQKARQEQLREEKLAAIEKKKEEVRNSQYAEYTKNFIKNKVEDLLENTLRQEFIVYFEIQENHFIIDRLKKKGLEDKMVWSNFESFIKAQHPELITDLCPIEDFTT